MAPVQNARVIFKEIPKGQLTPSWRRSGHTDLACLKDFPIPEKTTITNKTQMIDPDIVPLKGGFLLKTLVLSVDPYQRGRMRDPSVKASAVRIHHRSIWMHT